MHQRPSLKKKASDHRSCFEDGHLDVRALFLYCEALTTSIQRSAQDLFTSGFWSLKSMAFGVSVLVEPVPIQVCHGLESVFRVKSMQQPSSATATVTQKPHVAAVLVAASMYMYIIDIHSPFVPLQLELACSNVTTLQAFLVLVTSA